MHQETVQMMAHPMSRGIALCLLLVVASLPAQSGGPSTPLAAYDSVANHMIADGLRSCESYSLLRELVQKAPHRVSGSRVAVRAAEACMTMMRNLGFEHVRAETVMVP